MSDVGAGERLRRWRHYRNLSLRKLSGLSNVHTMTLHRIETGVQEARASELAVLAEALGCTLPEFFAFMPPAENDNAESGR